MSEPDAAIEAAANAGIDAAETYIVWPDALAFTRAAVAAHLRAWAAGCSDEGLFKIVLLAKAAELDPPATTAGDEED